ncbi:metallophosphoesterase [Sediminicurvatus halobius]|uniref:metallophosphoesterase n=1 Tax=Sediminicurvatus halobius TaxID=2182432 RepID=UPI0018EE51D7|nr:metallophosphoesterase [Spiribacter halobius]UEX77788.1 metallophosphoesterase [Spiribacter halobius]
MSDEPGRSCPLHYRYRLGPLAALAPLVEADSVLIAGGLYGNPEALDALQDRAAREGAALVFNGDFHWFDAEPAWFAAIQTRVLAHAALAGNVEAELAAASGAGCGCAYPEHVDAATVERSNAIMAALQGAPDPAARQALAALPYFGRVRAAGLEVLVLHGDAASLAGWSLAVEAFARTPAAAAAHLRDALVVSGADVIAATHTCLPHARALQAGGRWRALFNNGSAGLPNLSGDRRGLCTRIARTPAADALWRACLGEAIVEAVPVAYDTAAWWRRFAAAWPAGSPARESYAARLQAGPAFSPAQALGPGVRSGTMALPGRRADTSQHRRND